MMKQFILSLVFLLLCSPAFAEQVLLISWDGSEYSVVAELYQKGKLPNLSKLGELHHLTDNLDCGAITVTKSQHAIMLTGETTCVTGITRNLDMEPIPSGLTIYEKLPAEVMKAHSVSKNYLDENTFANAVPVIDVFFVGELEPKLAAKQVFDLISTWKDKDYFIFLHLIDPDHTGHRKGINSKEYRNALIKNDKYLGILLEKIKELSQDTKVIVLSDHGFGHPIPTNHGFAPDTFVVGTDSDMNMVEVTPFIMNLFKTH